jgi:hypothetical protein
MTMRKIREQCHTLCALRATIDEVRRRQLSDSDRYVAAFEVIKCAVSSLVPRTDYSRVLARTLNVAGEDSSLEQRRDRLQSEFYFTDKIYRRVEDEAFTHLAGALVAASQSPCSGPTVDGDAKIALDFRITLTANQLGYVLTLLSLERRSSIREQLSETLLEALPNALAVLSDEDQTRTERSWPKLRQIIGGILTYVWPPKRSTLRPNKPPIESTAFTAASMSDLLLGDQPDVDHEHLLVATAETKRYNIRLVEDERLNRTFFSFKAASLQHLAELIERYERNDAWREVLPGVDEPVGRDR